MNRIEGGFLQSERGWAICILTGLLIFGFYGIFIRLNPEISPFTFLYFFQAVGLLTWWLFFFARSRNNDWKQKMTGKEKREIFWLAVVALGNDLSFFYAMKLTSIANAVLAHQMVSIVMFFFAPILLGERMRKREGVSLFFSLIGLIVIYLGASTKTTEGINDFWGITLGLVSAVFLAFLIVLYKLLNRGGMSLGKINTYRYLWSIFLLLPLAGVRELKFGLDTARGDLVTLVAFGFLFAFVASGIHNLGMSKARGMVSTILGKMEPVIASIYAFLILGERVSPTTLVGGIIIVGSSIWLAFGRAKEGDGT